MFTNYAINKQVVILIAWFIFATNLMFNTVVGATSVGATAVTSGSWPSEEQAKPIVLSIEFTEPMLEAIQASVPLSLELDLVYITERLLINNYSLLEQHQIVITKHALSNRYMVNTDNNLKPHIFSTVEAARQHIAQEALRLFAEYHQRHQALASSADSAAYLKLSLNKLSLPGPVRLTAFFTRQWDFNTGWIKWNSAS